MMLTVFMAKGKEHDEYDDVVCFMVRGPWLAAPPAGWETRRISISL